MNGPIEVAMGPTPDGYFSAVRICGTPTLCTVAPSESFEQNPCGAAIETLVGHNLIAGGEVRLLAVGWTLVNPSLGTLQGGDLLRDVPLGETASVQLRSPEGTDHTLVFNVVDSSFVRLEAFTTD